MASGEVIGTFPSSSSDAVYEVRVGKDGQRWCSCPGWKFSKGTKSCKHLAQLGSGAPPANAPTPRPTVGLAPKAMLAHQIEKAPYEPWGKQDWSSEVKLDGYRLFAMMVAGKPRQFARSSLEHSGRYPWLDELPLPEGTVLDGEIVAPGEASAYATGSRQELEPTGAGVLAARGVTWRASGYVQGAGTVMAAAIMRLPTCRMSKRRRWRS